MTYDKACEIVRILIKSEHGTAIISRATNKSLVRHRISSHAHSIGESEVKSRRVSIIKSHSLS